MLAEVEGFFADPPAKTLVWHETTDADHGRIEIRRHAVTQSVDWLFSDRRYAGEPVMPGLATLAMVEAIVERAEPPRGLPAYYVSSAHLTPERFAKVVRAHWSIENSLLGPRHHLRRRPRPKPQGERPRKPRGPA